jgi:hypothetical protein
VVNASHEKHESVILNFDDKVRKAVRATLHDTLVNRKDREFARSRSVVKDIIDTTTDLVATTDQAYDIVRSKAD